MITVYRHRRNDNYEIFYVGIGKTEKRAYSKHGRNRHWKNIVNKAGYSVEIIAEADTWEDACELEQFLIQEYGRRDLGTGPLVNMTDGGEGMLGFKHSDETKQKLRDANLGKKMSEESKTKISKAQKGLKHSDETKSKLSKANKGEKHPMYGKPAHNRKKVICTETGKIWHTVGSCAIDNGLNKTTLTHYLNGRLKNKTTFRYIQTN